MNSRSLAGNSWIPMSSTVPAGDTYHGGEADIFLSQIEFRNRIQHKKVVSFSGHVTDKQTVFYYERSMIYYYSLDEKVYVRTPERIFFCIFFR